MRKFLDILNILRWCMIGAFIGTSLYKYYDFCRYPDLYAIQSAPWYLSIEINAIFTVIIFLIITVIRMVLKRKMK